MPLKLEILQAYYSGGSRISQTGAPVYYFDVDNFFLENCIKLEKTLDQNRGRARIPAATPTPDPTIPNVIFPAEINQWQVDGSKQVSNFIVIKTYLQQLRF